MTPELFCMAVVAGSSVVGAITAVSMRLLAARGVAQLAALPAIARALERVEGKVDAVAVDVETTRGFASAAKETSGSALGMLTRADERLRMGNGRGSRPGVTDTGQHRAIAASAEGEPVTARGGVEPVGVVR